jgi:hypothetical protein
MRHLRTAAPATVLVSLIATASAAVAATGEDFKPAYTPDQQKAAAEVLKGSAASLEQFEKGVAAASGSGGSSFRAKFGKGASAVKGLFKHKPPEQQAVEEGQELIRHLAVLEPALNACHVKGEGQRALSALANEASSLLVKRSLATAQDIKTWRQEASEPGDHHDKGDHQDQGEQVLNCAAVQERLSEALPSLQSASGKLHAASEEAPQGVLVPRVAK